MKTDLKPTLCNQLLNLLIYVFELQVFTDQNGRNCKRFVLTDVKKSWNKTFSINIIIMFCNDVIQKNV